MTDKPLDMQNDGEINIFELLQVMWNHKIVITALALLCSMLMFVKTTFFTDYTYTSYGVLHISNKTEAGIEETAIQKTDIETSKTLSTTYIEILKTRVFLQEISDGTGGKYTGKEIEEMLKLEPVNGTELLKISVTAKDSKDAYLIAQLIMDKAPEKLTSVYKSGEVEAVDPALYTDIPNSKGRVKNLAIGMMIGIMLGVAYAFLFYFFDKKVHRGEDIARRYDISILGETAQLDSGRSGRKAKAQDSELLNIISDKTDFDTRETYKSIRTNIMFSMPKKDKGRVVIVTSASPNEGKTTTTINLAITFAQTGAKVILVDCDLRKSRIHRFLQLERGEGVSNVVCGYTELHAAIQTGVRTNLDCLTAGEIPPNPAELLETVEFQEMIAELQQSYDYIFIDTPPITVVTDAAILMKMNAGVVVVARQDATTYDFLDAAISEIKKTGVNLLGAIVHDSSEKHKKYGYYKYGKYSYGYQYGDKRKEGTNS